MRRATPVLLTEEQKSRLERWSRGGSTPYRVVIRSRIVLLASRGYPNRAISRLLRTNPITVARWRSRFVLFGLDGLRKEAPHYGHPKPIAESVVRRIIEKTLRERPPGRVHWSTRLMARAVGVSHSTVRRVWRTHGIDPHRSRVALLAQESRFRPKRVDVVGVYVNPPQKAVALSFVDGPSSAPPGPEARTKEVSSEAVRRRPWMAELVTTLSLLERPQSLRTSRRHVDQEFLSFLRSVEERRAGPAEIVVLAESQGPSFSEALTKWLSRHPVLGTRLVGGSSPWEESLADSLRRTLETRLVDAPPASLEKLRAAISRWERESEGTSRPFAWTRD